MPEHKLHWLRRRPSNLSTDTAQCNGTAVTASARATACTDAGGAGNTRGRPRQSNHRHEIGSGSDTAKCVLQMQRDAASPHCLRWEMWVAGTTPSAEELLRQQSDRAALAAAPTCGEVANLKAELTKGTQLGSSDA